MGWEWLLMNPEEGTEDETPPDDSSASSEGVWREAWRSVISLETRMKIIKTPSHPSLRPRK